MTVYIGIFQLKSKTNYYFLGETDSDIHNKGMKWNLVGLTGAS